MPPVSMEIMLSSISHIVSCSMCLNLYLFALLTRWKSLCQLEKKGAAFITSAKNPPAKIITLNGRAPEGRTEISIFRSVSSKPLQISCPRIANEKAVY